eukprot:TRINITY_DN10205_c0_g1_i2.p1 TRINITY_DN10205_c0_g1~~TRINITY_DN10205_c0_g1_i2.p1  ORF type:complete len:620 (+),score=120.06 TRINITY_DN10205_c0_g1_i2:131-1990(+)
MEHTTTEENRSEDVLIEEKISKPNGEALVRKYSRGKLLGKGGFAKCYEITNHETKRLLAAKIICKSTLIKTRARQKLISEIKIHRSLNHSNVVQFEHVFEDQDNVYILLEMCSNQTLNELIKRRKRLAEIEVQSYVSQIISGLKYLHANRVIHRDLKLGNLFLSEKMELKIGDFGLATKLELEGERKRTVCGTPNYIAPEILENKNGHSYEVDIWSLGVIIYALLIGKPPFETPDVKTTYKKIRMNNFSFPDHVPISDSAKNLITRILVLDPTQRPTLDQILQDPFLNDVGSIPLVLPLSTLACPPSSSYIKQFQAQSNNLRHVVATKVQGENPPKGFDMKKSSTKSIEKVVIKGTLTPQDPNKMDEDKVLGHTKSIKLSDGVIELPPGSSQGVTNLFTPSLASKNLVGPETGKGKSEVYVTKWVDYSSKYGLGYNLSDGSTGVYFNDSTKIVMEGSGTYFEYMERKPGDKQDVVASFPLNDYPKDHQKKVTLLQHFKIYLENENNSAGCKPNEQLSPRKGTEPLIYVKKWMKTKHAIMFRLSNKIVQVDFKDKTEIILSSESKVVTYVNKKGDRLMFPLATALDSNNQEMTKRLKYTKEILTQMLNANQQLAAIQPHA